MVSIEIGGGIERYLRDVTEARTKAAELGVWELPKGMKYSCFEEFVLDKGRPFSEWSPRKYKLGQIKLCFHNAYMAAMRSRGHLTYVEGYAFWAAIPVMHAWCMDAEGRIVDTTWHGRETMVDKPLTPSNYYGVPFPFALIHGLRKRGGIALIDDWEHGWPLLQEEKK